MVYGISVLMLQLVCESKIISKLKAENMLLAAVWRIKQSRLGLVRQDEEGLRWASGTGHREASQAALGVKNPHTNQRRRFNT